MVRAIAQVLMAKACDARLQREVRRRAERALTASLDVWSFGAVVYEVLSGETLARRAGTGAAMVQAVAGVIGACPTQGPGALEYPKGQRWRSWAAAVMLAPSRPLPESGAQWDLVRMCFR